MFDKHYYSLISRINLWTFGKVLSKSAFDVLAYFDVLGEVGLEAKLVTTMFTCEVLLLEVYKLDVTPSAGAGRADGVTVAAEPLVDAQFSHSSQRVVKTRQAHRLKQRASTLEYKRHSVFNSYDNDLVVKI